MPLLESQAELNAWSAHKHLFDMASPSVTIGRKGDTWSVIKGPDVDRAGHRAFWKECKVTPPAGFDEMQLIENGGRMRRKFKAVEVFTPAAKKKSPRKPAE